MKENGTNFLLKKKGDVTWDSFQYNVMGGDDGKGGQA